MALGLKIRSVVKRAKTFWRVDVIGPQTFPCRISSRVFEDSQFVVGQCECERRAIVFPEYNKVSFGSPEEAFLAGFGELGVCAGKHGEGRGRCEIGDPDRQEDLRKTCSCYFLLLRPMALDSKVVKMRHPNLFEPREELEHL